MMRSFLLLLLSTICLQSAAQQTTTTPKTLLWRISGNGLQKSSYLFGTMHLNDKRLFNFDDSVYLSIEKCEGLAIELNPDEMMTFQITRMFDEFTKGQSLKNMLSYKDYDRYSKKLSRKFNKPAHELTTSDIIKEKNRWMTEYFQKGEMPTFVDAFLYNIAKKQGKWVGGIEDIPDQIGIIEASIDNSDIETIIAQDEKNTDGKKTIDRMIAIYNSQDIEGMYRFMNNDDKKDLALIRRNVKMAERMDSLSAIRTMFFAVGAAHLAGDSGVINLLAKRGFTVEPVFSTKKIKSSDYKLKEVETPWVDVRDKNGLYNVKMPGAPTPIRLYGMIDMNVMIDIFSLTGFYTMAASRSGLSVNNEDSVIHSFAQNVLMTNKKLTSKSIIKNGIAGREFIEPMSSGLPMRLQLFVNDDVLYCAAMFALKKPELNSSDAENFFNSLLLHKKASLPLNTGVEFKDSIMGISLVSPAPLELNTGMGNLGNDAWKITAYTGSDIKNGTFIMLFSREVRAGYLIQSDSLVFAEQEQKFEENHINVKRKDSISGDMKFVELMGRNKKDLSLYTRSLSTIKNNRNILLMALADSTVLQNAPVENLFSSLQFITPNSVKWNWHTNKKYGVTAWMPGDFRNIPDDFQFKSQVMTYDTTTATSYFVAVDTLSKYAYYSSDSIMWASLIKENAGENKATGIKHIKKGNIEGKEFVVEPGINSKVYERTQILLADSVMYRITTSAGRKLIFSDNVNKLFETIKIDGNGKPDFLLKPKATLILADILDTSQAVRNEAFNSIEMAPFAETDLSLLYDALFKEYLSPSYDSVKTIDINNKIGEAIAKLKNEKTISYIENIYPTLKGENQSIALSVLANMQTSKSFAKFAELVTKKPLDQGPGDYLYSALRDSLELTAAIFPQLLSLASDTAAGPAITRLALELKDSTLIDSAIIDARAADFILLAKKLLPQLIKDSIDYIYDERPIVSMLSYLKTKDALNTLAAYQQVNEKYFQALVIRLLIKNKQEVKPELLTRHAKDKAMRADLYDGLYEAKRLDLFPKQFATQQYYAESKLDEASYDYAEPAKMEFIATKESMLNGKKYVFYLYKLTYGEGEETTRHLGIAGGFSKDKTAIKPLVEVFAINYDDEYDARESDAQLKELLKSYEESED